MLVTVYAWCVSRCIHVCACVCGCMCLCVYVSVCASVRAHARTDRGMVLNEAIIAHELKLDSHTAALHGTTATMVDESRHLRFLAAYLQVQHKTNPKPQNTKHQTPYLCHLAALWYVQHRTKHQTLNPWPSTVNKPQNSKHSTSAIS